MELGLCLHTTLVILISENKYLGSKVSLKKMYPGSKLVIFKVVKISALGQNWSVGSQNPTCIDNKSISSAKVNP